MISSFIGLFFVFLFCLFIINLLFFVTLIFSFFLIFFLLFRLCSFVLSFFLFVSFFQFSFLVNAGRESAASPWSVWNKTDNNAWTASRVIVSPFSSDSGLALTDLYTHGPRLRFLLLRSSLGSVAATARFHSTSCRTFLPPSSSSSSCSGIARSRPLHHRLRLGETFFSDKSL